MNRGTTFSTIRAQPTSLCELQSFINYYCRKGYYASVIELCESHLSRGEDPIIRLWFSYSQSMQGNLSEAIKGYNIIKEKKEIQLAAYIGLITAHEQSAHQDEQEIEQLKTLIDLEKSSAPDSAKLQSALLYLLLNEYDYAKEVLEEVDEKYKDQYTSLSTVKAWINLVDEELEAQECEQLFDACIKQDSRNLDAWMGKVKSLEKQKKIQNAVDIINQVVVNFPQFTPALIEKCSLYIQLDDWEQCRENSLRIQKNDPNNIDALIFNVLYMLIRGYTKEDLINQFTEMVKAITKRESRNDKLCYGAAKTFSVLAEENEELLKKCLELVNLAKKVNPIESDYFVLQGHIQLIMKDYINSETSFRKALDLNESSLEANKGLYKCFVLQGKKELASHYKDFLADIELMGDDEDTHESKESKSEILFLNALFEQRCNKNSEDFTKHLSEAIAEHEKETRSIKRGLEYYSILNPHFLLEICSELLRSCPSEPLNPTDPPPIELTLCTQVLSRLTSDVPGMTTPQILLAKTKFISRDFESAQRIITRIQQLDPKNSPAHILLAQIAYFQENYTLASTELERAMSYDFSVTKQSEFNLLKAKVLAAKGETKDAIQNLERILKSESIQNKKISDDELVSVYLELSSVHSRRNEHIEASKYIEQALEKFSNTDLSGRIMIANAKLSVSRKDFETALSILCSVPPTSPYFLKAKAETAIIHLNHRNDKKSFAKCYEELVEKSSKSTTSYIFLGDAYMKIQEPEKAIDAYQEALSLDPTNVVLRNKIAKTLIMVHNYEEAISCFKEALSTGSQDIETCHELAQLYLKLKRFKESETTLKETLKIIENKKSLQPNVMSQYVKTLLLLSNVHNKMGDTQTAMNDLDQARNMQSKVLSKLQSSQQDSLFSEKQIIAKICYELGVYYKSLNDTKKAIPLFNEALQNDETNEQSMLALAEIYLKDNDTEGCQSQCTSLLRMNKSHEQATIMMADIMFRNNRFDEAIDYFQNFLQQKPNNYNTLYKLITLLKRSGKLEEAEKFLDMAKKYSPKEQYDPGYHFCNGIYHLYRNNPREALQWFNTARKSVEWGELATVNMIEIYLNPDTTALIDSNSIDAPKDTRPKGQFYNESRTESITAAEKLLDELTTNVILPFKKKTLQGYLKLAKSKTKDEIEKSIPIFGEMILQDAEYVPAIVALSYAFQLSKQTPKARQQLKRISKMDIIPGWEDDFERGWLLLAEINIASGKYDVAQELLKKITQVNKSCAKAWELDGVIYEKSNSFLEAADCYEKAWKLTFESSPSIGYKLSFNYLKAKKYIEAIDVCHKILNKHPNYPKIKTEILDKARQCIRP
ncbi:hypothetical protein ABK040_005977 [Willaertia magna]